MSEETPKLDEGEIHDILRNDRRRAVIEFLSERGDHATIRELSEHIASLESGEDPPPRNVRQSVYVSLHQTHLPKLEGLGVVDYDTDSKDVQLRERATSVEAYMGQDSSVIDRFALTYLVIGSLGVLLALASFATGSIAGPGIGVGMLVLFAAVTGLGAYQLWIQ